MRGYRDVLRDGGEQEGVLADEAAASGNKHRVYAIAATVQRSRRQDEREELPHLAVWANRPSLALAERASRLRALAACAAGSSFTTSATAFTANKSASRPCHGSAAGG
mgnify:CR=1 FL=1